MMLRSLGFGMALALLLPGAGRAADPDAVARGAYLAAAAGCDQCHTDKEHKGQPYAGGRVLKTPYGAIPTPNITPDKGTGIGAWSYAEFTRALRWGIAPDDTHYLPEFPFPYYAGLRDADIADLKAFLDSLPPATQDGLQGPDSMALAERAWAAVKIALTPPQPAFEPDPAKDAAWNRGAYLAATVGRCRDCHGANLAGDKSRKAPNITPDPATGIGKWSEDDVLTLLKEGQTPDVDFVGGAMAEIVRNTSRLTDADRKAIAVYLRSVAPVASHATK